MKKSRITLLVAVLALISISCTCGLLDKATSLVGGGSSGGGLTNAGQLWSDVPQMDGLTKSDMDMPLPLKLVTRTIMGNLGRLNGAGQDQTTGNIDWIVFTTDKTAADVEAFYTPQLMADNGWDKSDQSTCFSGSDQGVSQVGVICVFQKSTTDPQVQLAILTYQENANSQNTVFFLRLEESPTPAPN